MNPNDPCASLAAALDHLRSTYGPPRTRAQIAAWNEVQGALEDHRLSLGLPPGGQAVPPGGSQ